MTADRVDWNLAAMLLCRDCTERPDGTLAPCGWHENTVAAAAVVERMADKERKQ